VGPNALPFFLERKAKGAAKERILPAPPNSSARRWKSHRARFFSCDNMRVLMDTNFLMVPFERHVDVFVETDELLHSKTQILVLASTLIELRNLKGKYRLNARAMIDFIARQPGRFEIIKQEGKTDELILEFAKQNLSEEGLYFATMDKRLKDKLRDIGARVIILRGKGHLAFA
jgi:rRNA-processing protein FCF1